MRLEYEDRVIVLALFSYKKMSVVKDCIVDAVAKFRQGHHVDIEVFHICLDAFAIRQGGLIEKRTLTHVANTEQEVLDSLVVMLTEASKVYFKESSLKHLDLKVDDFMYYVCYRVPLMLGLWYHRK